MVFLSSFAFWCASLNAEVPPPVTWTQSGATITASFNTGTNTWVLTVSGTFSGSAAVYYSARPSETPGWSDGFYTAYSGGTLINGSATMSGFGTTVLWTLSSNAMGSETTRYIGKAAAAAENIRIDGINSKNTDIRIEAKDKNGVTIWDSGTIPPGAAYDSGNLVVTGKTPVTYNVFYRSQYGDKTWTEGTPGEIPTSSPVNPTPLPSPTPSASPVPPTPPGTPPPAPLPAPNPSPTQNTINNSNVSMWAGATAGTTDTERLDKATYKQGVDKLESTLKDGFAGELEKQGKARSDFQSDIEAQAAAMDLEGKANATTFTDAMDGETKAGMGTTAGTASTGVAASMPYGVAGTSFQLDLNPFTSVSVPSWLKQLLGLVKVLLAWWAVLMLFLETSKKVRMSTLAALSVQSGKTGAAADAATAIPVVGAPVSFAIHLFGYVFITAVIMALPAGLAAIYDSIGSLDFGGYRAQLNTLLASGGTLGQVLKLCFGIVPFPTLLLCLSTRIISEHILTGGGIASAVWMRLWRL